MLYIFEFVICISKSLKRRDAALRPYFHTCRIGMKELKMVLHMHVPLLQRENQEHILIASKVY
jgi:hypothetical protein